MTFSLGLHTQLGGQPRADDTRAARGTTDFNPNRQGQTFEKNGRGGQGPESGGKQGGPRGGEGNAGRDGPAPGQTNRQDTNTRTNNQPLAGLNLGAQVGPGVNVGVGVQVGGLTVGLGLGLGSGNGLGGDGPRGTPVQDPGEGAGRGTDQRGEGPRGDQDGGRTDRRGQQPGNGRDPQGTDPNGAARGPQNGEGAGPNQAQGAGGDRPTALRGQPQNTDGRQTEARGNDPAGNGATTPGKAPQEQIAPQANLGGLTGRIVDNAGLAVNVVTPLVEVVATVTTRGLAQNSAVQDQAQVLVRTADRIADQAAFLAQAAATPIQAAGAVNAAAAAATATVTAAASALTQDAALLRPAERGPTAELRLPTQPASIDTLAASTPDRAISTAASVPVRAEANAEAVVLRAASTGFAAPQQVQGSTADAPLPGSAQAVQSLRNEVMGILTNGATPAHREVASVATMPVRLDAVSAAATPRTDAVAAQPGSPLVGTGNAQLSGPSGPGGNPLPLFNAFLTRRMRRRPTHRRDRASGQGNGLFAILRVLSWGRDRDGSLEDASVEEDARPPSRDRRASLGLRRMFRARRERKLPDDGVASS